MKHPSITCPHCKHQFVGVKLPPHLPCDSFSEPPTDTPEQRDVAAGYAEARAMIEAGINP